MPDSLIKVDHLKVVYNQGKQNEIHSLDDVSVEISPEEYVIIFGPSGCGKSTLLYGISGLQAPSAGTVEVMGKNLAEMTKAEKVDFHQTKVGMVFQAFYLIETLTVLDNVLLPKVFRGDDLVEGREVAMNLLKRFGVDEHADKFPSQLSGGQKQRVSIARTLVNNPSIILADEPTGALDSESAKNVLEIFREINEVDKKTLIMVTHNPEQLRQADRVIRMKDGKKVAEELNREKRLVREDGKGGDGSSGGGNGEQEPVPAELKMLTQSFSGLTSQQVGGLLIPFKAKQLLNFALMELNNEQVKGAEGFLNDVLSGSLGIGELSDKLDLNVERGGAGWNRMRAESFSRRIEEVLEAVRFLKSNPEKAADFLSSRFVRRYKLALDEKAMLLMAKFIALRISGKMNHSGLRRHLDASKSVGGVGLHKSTAEKISREVEIIMLMGYQG